MLGLPLRGIRLSTVLEREDSGKSILPIVKTEKITTPKSSSRILLFGLSYT